MDWIVTVKPLDFNNPIISLQRDPNGLYIIKKY